MLRVIRNTVFILLGTFLMFSCDTENLEKRIQALEQDSIKFERIASEKEEIINDFIKSMNEIDSSLSQIKERENIISTRFSKGNVELNEKAEDQILEDVRLIGDLLKENKSKISNLSSKLKSSNIKIKELEKMLQRLADQIQNKDAQIEDLQLQLANKNGQLEELLKEYYNRLDELKEQQDKLQSAYYCYGTLKELKAQRVVSREGGFVGIGRTNKLAENFNKEYFTTIDITVTKEIEFMSEKTKVITNHATSSYKMEQQGANSKLVILDPELFWASSKYLVVIVD